MIAARAFGLVIYMRVHECWLEGLTNTRYASNCVGNVPFDPVRL